MFNKKQYFNIQLISLIVTAAWLSILNIIAIAYSRPASDDFCVVGLKAKSHSWWGFLIDTYIHQNGRIVSMALYDGLSTFNRPFGGYWPSRLAPTRNGQVAGSIPARGSIFGIALLYDWER